MKKNKKKILSVRSKKNRGTGAILSEAEILQRIIEILYPANEKFEKHAHMEEWVDGSAGEIHDLMDAKNISFEEAKAILGTKPVLMGMASQVYDRGRTDAADYLAWEVVSEIENLLAKNGYGPLAKLFPILDRIVKAI